MGHPGDEPKLLSKLINFLLKTASNNVYEDMVKTVDLVRQSGLDWTIVRVPRLTDDLQTGKLRVGMVDKGVGVNLSRADMAAVMLEQVESDRYVK